MTRSLKLRLAQMIVLSLLAQPLAASAGSKTDETNSSSNNKGQVQKNKQEVFTDDDLKEEQVRGKWKLGSSADLKQPQDPSVPVVLAYTVTFYGQGKYTGRLKISEAKIENRSPKPTQSLQLRWFIVNREEPEAVMLEGLMPSFEVRIEPYSASEVDIPPIYFNKIVKPLLKDGELNGNLLLMVGVQEVQFADGMKWQRSPQTSFMKISFAGEPYWTAKSYPLLFYNFSLERNLKSQSLNSAPAKNSRS
jgi:hypothetical protein